MGIYEKVTILVWFSDVNDNDPQFCCSPYAVTVSEDIPSSETVLQLAATDLDSYPAGKIIIYGSLIFRESTR